MHRSRRGRARDRRQRDVPADVGVGGRDARPRAARRRQTGEQQDAGRQQQQRLDHDPRDREQRRLLRRRPVDGCRVAQEATAVERRLGRVEGRRDGRRVPVPELGRPRPDWRQENIW